jgi:hypothetical protein
MAGRRLDQWENHLLIVDRRTDSWCMASPDNLQTLNTAGIWFLTGSGVEIVTGVAIAKSGLVRYAESPTTFKVIVGCHLFVGLFCYFGHYFV